MKLYANPNGLHYHTSECGFVVEGYVRVYYSIVRRRGLRPHTCILSSLPITVSRGLESLTTRDVKGELDLVLGYLKGKDPTIYKYCFHCKKVTRFLECGNCGKRFCLEHCDYELEQGENDGKVHRFAIHKEC